MGKHRKPEKAHSKQNTQETPAKKPKLAVNGTKVRQAGLIFEPRPDWHAAPIPQIDVPNAPLRTLPPEILQAVQSYAETLLKSESARYDATHLQKSSDHSFMNTVMTSGTWGDRVGALTLVVQESPLHTRKQFESLVGLASKRSRDNALTALAALKDMLSQGHLLPESRKLRYFGKQPGLLAAFQGVKFFDAGEPLPAGGLTEAHLLSWIYEDWLKRSYFEVLRLIESWLSDAIENARTRSLDFVFELLKERPEQEENLLRLLVNKLGDTNKKIASKASHRILRVQNFHPSMKGVIVSAIESEVLLKPGQNDHAKYYAAITLNQTVLSTNDPETANKLIDVYFGVFVALLNRSKHQAKAPKAVHSGEDKDDRKRKRKGKPQLAPDDPDNPEKQLEDKLVAQVLTGIQRAFPYTSQDNNDKLETHIQTLFSITHSSNFGTSLRALTLLHGITSSQSATIGSSSLRDRFMRSLYESLLDPRLITATGKHTMYLNLLYRSLKDDSSVTRVRAFIKRLLQTCVLHEPPFMVSVLYLVSELGTAFPSLKTLVTEAGGFAEDSDEEESFHDVPDQDDAPVTGETTNVKLLERAPNGSSHQGYDPRKRDPLYANAENASLWDVNALGHHYHPSISLFVDALVPHSNKGKASRPPKPDPAGHTLTHFLDRFAYRNPKPIRDPSSGDPKALRGSSLMQPALASKGTTDNFLASRAAMTEAPVSSESFWQRRAEEVAPHDVFFHRYFSAIGPSRKAAKDRKRTEPSAGTGKEDDEYDDEIGANEDDIWKALVSSRKELESEDEDEDEEDEGVDEDFTKAMMSGSDDEAENGIVELNLESDDDGGVELDLASDDTEGDGAASGIRPRRLVGDDVDRNEPTLEIDEDENPFGSEDDAEDDEEESENGGDNERDGRKAKRRKLSALPTFADADVWAKMIEEGEVDQDSA